MNQRKLPVQLTGIQENLERIRFRLEAVCGCVAAWCGVVSGGAATGGGARLLCSSSITVRCTVLQKSAVNCHRTGLLPVLGAPLISAIVQANTWRQNTCVSPLNWRQKTRQNYRLQSIDRGST